MDYLKRHPGLVKFMIVFLLLFIIFALFIRNTVFPVIFSIAETQAIRRANKNINQVIEKEVDGIDYEQLISYKTNNKGDIVLMQPDVRKINQISSKISLGIHNHWEEIDNIDIKVPVLKIIGFDILAGMGPNMTIKVIPVGFNNPPTMNDSFEEAGINQTRHKIYLEIDFALKLIVPFSSKITRLKAQVPVIEATIVGNVPEIYVGMDGEKSSGILDEINN
ncbi:MAG: sporulation protein YunB [Bacillota bacterium]